MVDLKGKSWLIPLSSGILIVLFAIIPSIIYYKPDTNFTLLSWIFGSSIINSNGAISTEFFQDSELVGLGVSFYMIFLIIGIFLLLSAILTMKGKNIPHIGLIWLISGILLLVLPTLYQASFWGLCDISKLGDEFEILMYGFSTLTLYPIAGFLAIVPGIQELAKR